MANKIDSDNKKFNNEGIIKVINPKDSQSKKEYLQAII